MRIIVLHRMYGCETGCCGHCVVVDDQDPDEGIFDFVHPYLRESPREFAERLVRNNFGEEHVKDLDWESCEIIDD